MWSDEHSSRARDLFADQFEGEGSGFVYRRGGRGAPVRVSAEERDEFIAAFGRSSRRLTWALVGAVVLVVVALSARRSSDDHLLIVSTVALCLLFMLLFHRIWNAPARALRGRPVIGSKRSRSEMRDRMAERTRWQDLIFMALVIPLAAVNYAAAEKGSLGRWFWLALLIVAPISLGTLAWRKWRLAGRRRR